MGYRVEVWNVVPGERVELPAGAVVVSGSVETRGDLPPWVLLVVLVPDAGDE